MTNHIIAITCLLLGLFFVLFAFITSDPNKTTVSTECKKVDGVLLQLSFKGDFVCYERGSSNILFGENDF